VAGFVSAVDSPKELLAMTDGFLESKRSFRQLLLDLKRLKLTCCF
jgi:hypothetical protein